MISLKLHSLKLLVVAAHEGRESVHIDKLLPSLKAMGLQISYVGWDRRSKLPACSFDNGIEYQMIFRGWGYANHSLMLGVPLWMLRLWGYLLFSKRPDLIMAIDFDTGLPTAIASLITGVPFIYNIRDNFAMRAAVPWPFRPLVAALDWWVVRRATRIIVPDEIRITATDERVRNKFVVIRNCAADVKPVETSIEDRPFTVYAMGYLRESRGIGLLLEVAQRLPKARVLLAGNVPEPSLSDRIKGIPNVDFRGYLSIEEALKLCFESDVIFTFYAPDSEINRRAISNKWSDAMMASKPILVNSEVLKSAWIRQEDIGYICPYGDVDQLIQVLEHIRLNPEEARRKGKNGRRLYEAGYSWPPMEQRLQKMLEEVVQGLPG